MTSDAPRPRLTPPTVARHCPWCGSPTPPDYVHGHAQCVACKKNIDPCCEGEQACPPPSP